MSYFISKGYGERKVLIVTSLHVVKLVILYFNFSQYIVNNIKKFIEPTVVLIENNHRNSIENYKWILFLDSLFRF